MDVEIRGWSSSVGSDAPQWEEELNEAVYYILEMAPDFFFFKPEYF